MATTRTANAHWEGSLIDGKGTVALSSSGIGTYDVSWAARAEEPNGVTSPEELIAAAHSTCFSMALSNELAKAGSPPDTIDTRADVTFQPGEGITGIVISVVGVVPGIDEATFVAAAEGASARLNRTPVRLVKRKREKTANGANFSERKWGNLRGNFIQPDLHGYVDDHKGTKFSNCTDCNQDCTG